MQSFLGEHFLLRTDSARRLWFDHAARQPIVDYHSHLDPTAIADDRQFADLTALWLDDDHYKWRALRAAGIDETLITGRAAPVDRFHAFASIVPQCIGNPLYHWTHMELARPFGIRDLRLDASTAAHVWQRCDEQLAEPGFRARGLLEQFGVRMIGTTDDPIDSLAPHAALARDASFPIAVQPTWRPDLLLKPETDEFANWIEALGTAAGVGIADYGSLLAALERRLGHFAAHGCVSADHGVDRFEFSRDDPDRAATLLRLRLDRRPIGNDDAIVWRSTLLTWLGRAYARRGWVMQLHIGAQRDNNSRMLARIGRNAGFDSIGDSSYAEPLARFLDTLDRDALLPKTILYGLNPRDNEMLATMAGNFQGDGIPGKMQFGSAWWFNDQRDGMLRQLMSLAQMGLLARFVGMLTDSRSFLSFSRHEYFRRILCDLIGGWVDAGEAPADFALLGGIVEDICSRNAIAYFGLGDRNGEDRTTQ